MTEKQLIIDSISKRVTGAKKSDYTIWIIGITNDPERRKGEHFNEKQNVEYWMQWHTDSADDAREIEQYFISKGMKGGTGGGNPDDKPDWVYIF